MNLFLIKKNTHFITIFYLFQNIQVFTYMSYNKINKIFGKKKAFLNVFPLQEDDCDHFGIASRASKL